MWMVRLAPGVLLLQLIAAGSLAAQISVHPTSTSAELLDTISVTVDIVPNVAESHVEMTTWLLPDGSYEYLLDIESLEFSGSGLAVDTTALATMVDLLAHQACLDASALGQPNGCAAVDTVIVRSHAMAKRIGSGTSTQFQVCNPDSWCARQYESGCDNGQPAVTALDIPDISSTCDGTADESACAGGQ
jgi:hypothetical protein